MEAIKNRVGGAEEEYQDWTIGITDDAKERKQEHNDSAYWYHWKTEVKADAIEIKDDFLGKGMKDDNVIGDSTGENPVYVYIFLSKNNASFVWD